MLHAEKYHEETMTARNDAKDSGYNTNNTVKFLLPSNKFL